jgi:hypothetical protein
MRWKKMTRMKMRKITKEIDAFIEKEGKSNMRW